MTAMLSNMILIAAFGLVAVAALVLVAALYQVGGRGPGEHIDSQQSGPKGG
jgi:hypothetical protein